MHEFSRVVQSAMDHKKITIAQVARETGYSWQYINDLLRSKRRWNEETIHAVGGVLGIKISYQFDATGTDT